MQVSLGCCLHKLVRSNRAKILSLFMGLRASGVDEIILKKFGINYQYHLVFISGIKSGIFPKKLFGEVP